jgi:hypothetical protein
MAHEKIVETKEELEALAGLLERRIADLRKRADILENELWLVLEKRKDLIAKGAKP